jgi:hypothetical protein
VRFETATGLYLLLGLSRGVVRFSFVLDVLGVHFGCFQGLFEIYYFIGILFEFFAVCFSKDGYEGIVDCGFIFFEGVFFCVMIFTRKTGAILIKSHDIDTRVFRIFLALSADKGGIYSNNQRKEGSNPNGLKILQNISQGTLLL